MNYKNQTKHIIGNFVPTFGCETGGHLGGIGVIS